MKKFFGIITAAVFTVAVAFNVMAASMAPPAGYTQAQRTFDEQFTAPILDTTKWNNSMGDDNWGRWSNNGKLPAPYSAMNCADANCSDGLSFPYYDPFPYGYNVKIDYPHLIGGNGNLSIIARPSDHFATQGYKWATAAISTYGKLWLPKTGGYVQIHAKMPDARFGAWPALWLLSKNGGEIDIHEGGYVKGTAPVNNVLAMNYHATGNSQIIVDTGVDLSAAYHTYGLEYRPGQWLKMYLDGKLMASYTQNIPTNADYEIIIDMEFANKNVGGWHTISDAVNHPGPFQYDIDNVQIYSLTTVTPPPTGDTTPPTVPTGLKTTSVSGTEIALAWNASTDASSPITYDVYRDGAYLNFTATTSYKDATVTAGTTYKYQVLAYDPARNLSALSTAVTATATATTPPVTDTTPPSVPTVATTLVAPVEIDLAWTASTDNVGVSGYNIFRNGIKIGTTNTTSYADTSVIGASSYTYVVQAYDAAGNVANSPGLAVSTPTFSNGAAVATNASTAVMGKAGRGATVCTQAAGVAGTILSGPQSAKGQVWWYVSFATSCSGWVPQTSLVLN